MGLVLYRITVFLFTYRLPFHSFFFFFNDTATTEIYTLSLHDALPIFANIQGDLDGALTHYGRSLEAYRLSGRSEEHTSELQSHLNLVCRLLLEKKKKSATTHCRIRCTTLLFYFTVQSTDLHCRTIVPF